MMRNLRGFFELLRVSIKELLPKKLISNTKASVFQKNGKAFENIFKLFLKLFKFA